MKLETILLLKYGVPLAFKLLGEGKSATEVKNAVEAIKIVSGVGGTDVKEALAEADEKQTNGIVEGLFGVLTGVTDAFSNLLKAIGGLFGKD